MRDGTSGIKFSTLRAAETAALPSEIDTYSVCGTCGVEYDEGCKTAMTMRLSGQIEDDVGIKLHRIALKVRKQKLRALSGKNLLCLVSILAPPPRFRSAHVQSRTSGGVGYALSNAMHLIVTMGP